MKVKAASITTILAVASSAVAQCAVCPTEIVVGNTVYYDVASSGGLGEPQFCSYNSDPSGGVNLSQVCWYGGSGGLITGNSWSECPSSTSTQNCTHQN